MYQVFNHFSEQSHINNFPVPVTKWVCQEENLAAEDFRFDGSWERQQVPIDREVGYRLQFLFAKGLVEGYSPIIMVGSDCPNLTPELLQEAYQKLETSDVVFGPAKSGGYYLLGLNYLVPELFTDIPWGTEQVLCFSLTAASQLQLKVDLLPELHCLEEETVLHHDPHQLR